MLAAGEVAKRHHLGCRGNRFLNRANFGAGFDAVDVATSLARSRENSGEDRCRFKTDFSCGLEPATPNALQHANEFLDRYWAAQNENRRST